MGQRSAPKKIKRPSFRTIRNFFSHVKQSNSSACWEWTGAIDRDGYGKFRYSTHQKSSVVHASRVAYAIFYGEAPKGMDVHHTCLFRACVNPEHLKLETPTVNRNHLPQRKAEEQVPF